MDAPGHADPQAEMKLAIPTVPVIFMKPAASLAHPSETIRVPPAAQNDDLDYEVEFTVVIGQTCRDVTESEALGFVCGYTAANDLTARKQQKAASQWGFAKGECLSGAERAVRLSGCRPRRDHRGC